MMSHPMKRLTTFGLRTVRRRLRRRPPPSASGGATTLTLDEVAGLLSHWRTRVIAEASRLPRWSGVPAAELDDHYGAVCETLLHRHTTVVPYNDAEHLHNSLWQHLAWKRGHYYQSSARRNQALEDAAEPIASDHGLKVVATADAAVVRDFMAELTEEEQTVFRLRFAEELSENKIAARLGVRQADVKRALYHSERKLGDFSALSEAGRLCAKRAEAISRLAAEGDRAERVTAAHAHLAACPACRVAYNTHRRKLANDTASLLTVPPAD